MQAEAWAQGASVLFIDAAHFRADADLLVPWRQRGEAALVETTSPRRGEKTSYAATICLEIGEVDAMPVQGHKKAEGSVAFLAQLRTRYIEPLVVSCDHGSALQEPAIGAT